MTTMIYESLSRLLMTEFPSYSCYNNSKLQNSTAVGINESMLEIQRTTRRRMEIAEHQRYDNVSLSDTILKEMLSTCKIEFDFAAESISNQYLAGRGKNFPACSSTLKS